MNDVSLLDNPQDSHDALASPPEATPEAPAAPACEKCASPLASGMATACTRCGWYSSIGAYVEIEQEWEEAFAAGGPVAQKESMLDVWLHLIPVWAWKLLGFGMSAFAGCIAIRALVEDAAMRSYLATAIALIAIFVEAMCHLTTTVIMSMDDPDVSLIDAVVSPTKSWRRMIKDMPRRLWLAGIAVFAVFAAFGANFIIGGIDYDRIWDWDIKPPVKKSLLGAIEKAGAGDPEMSMEEAMESFANDAAVEGAGGEGMGGKKKHNGPVNLVRQKIDVLILGYQTDRNGQVSTFFVASEVNGKLFYAGRVTPNLLPDENLKLVERLRMAKSSRPVVSAPDEANWVQPRFTCSVSYDKRVESGRLQGILWEEMRAEVKLPW